MLEVRVALCFMQECPGGLDVMESYGVDGWVDGTFNAGDYLEHMGTKYCVEGTQNPKVACGNRCPHSYFM